MKLIKSAIVFKAEIPVDATTLHNHLAERAFHDPNDLETGARGFVPVDEFSGSLVEQFPGGLAFRVRIDDKILPGTVVTAATEKAIAKIQQAEGRKVGKTERKDIRLSVFGELCKRALVRTTASITCFYHAESGFLIVPTTSKRIADTCVSLLVHAVGSVKTETIHVSDVKHGLTTRLKKWIDEQGHSDAFGQFSPCDEAALELMKRKITVKMGSLHAARQGLLEALNHGFNVKSLGFEADGHEFRLTDEFRLKGINYSWEHSDQGDDEQTWSSMAMQQVEVVVGIVSQLVTLLSYQADAADVSEGGETD